MPDLIERIMTRFQSFDRNADGAPAIVSLGYLNFELLTEEIPSDARIVLVLVEPRLLNPIPGTEDLMSRLLRFKGDLRAEGFYSRFIRADVYRGPRHQDGRTLLAIRSFLREVKIAFPNLMGVILLGAFPEAMLVRRCIWRPSFDVIIAGVQYRNTPYLAIEPEIIAFRADIVLGDVNGNWGSLYREGPERIESIRALPDPTTAATAWPVDGGVFSSTAFERETVEHRDFFWIQDDDYTILSSPPGTLRISIRHRLRHPEVSDLDRRLPNPIARPDILVSRINALHIAVNPDPAIRGDDGTSPLDASGYPQAFTSRRNYNTGPGMFRQHPALERQLLCDYFDRNHRFRIGAFADQPFRAGAITCSADFSAAEKANYLSTASSSFQPPLVQESATLLEYVRWFKQPAVLRCIHAHSSPWNTGFRNAYSVVDLEREVGGRPFRWRRDGNTYRPSFQDQGGAADLFLHRTIWQNRVLNNTGANLIIHGGCEANAPAGTTERLYHEEGYATFQNAETILFYMNGVALVARAKVFYDLPRGFPGVFALSPRARFGDGWKAYFDNEANDSELAIFRNAIDCKRSYFWSMVGDWTVRLRYRGGLGILGFNPQIQSIHVHPDRAWIDGWNFETGVNSIRGVGDIDGDGIAEFVVTSDWGIGILKHHGNRWRQVMVAPRDTWFGGWRYNASVNIGRDRIHGVANFTGGPAHEILLTSSWGIGVLGLTRSTLTSVVIQPNGTRFGGWLFDSRANQIVGFGDMDGDGIDELVIISDWGIGVLKAAGNTFNSLMLAPNGTRFGGWLFNSRQNTIHNVADFDGDNQAEILITSNWGIGILKLQTNQLISIAMHANGSNLNGYNLNTRTARIAVVSKLAGGNQRCILITDSDGLHVLQLHGGSLRRIASLRNGQRADGWLLNTTDNIFGPAGDLDGDGRDELVVPSPWGLGILKVQGDTFRCQTLHAYRTHLGDWILEPNDRVVGVGNFTGSSARSELLIQKGA